MPGTPGHPHDSERQSGHQEQPAEEEVRIERDASGSPVLGDAVGGEQAQQYLNLPSSISMVFQGMLLFFLLGSDVFIHYRLRLRRRAATAR